MQGRWQPLVISLDFSRLFIYGVENRQCVAQCLSRLVGIPPAANLVHSECLISICWLPLWKLNSLLAPLFSNAQQMLPIFCHSSNSRNPPICKLSCQIGMNVKLGLGSILNKYEKNKDSLVCYAYNIYLSGCGSYHHLNMPPVFGECTSMWDPPPQGRTKRHIPFLALGLKS